MENYKIKTDKEPDWYKLPLPKVKELLSADFHRGLAANEAEARLQLAGPNTLPEEKKDAYLKILLRQVRSPLVYILLFAAFLSLSLRDYADLAIIMTVVAINVVVGFFQENKANSTLTELSKVVKHKAAVLRDGVVSEIEAVDIVVGDVIRVAAGNRVPADARLIDVLDLEIVEAALTGESVPALKNNREIAQDAPLADQDNMIFMGTEVVNGAGYAVAVATGLRTQIGKIAEMLVDVKEEITPLQRNLRGFSRMLAWATLFLGFLVLIVGILKEQDFFVMLLTAVAVAVATIPEGLLISLTAILSVGMQRILRKRGLVRHLASAETLGATSIICMDKTGTLTEGRMKLASLVSASEEFHHQPEISQRAKGESLLRLLRMAALVNEAVVENPEKAPGDWNILGNSTDRALLVAAAESGFYRADLEKSHKLVSQLPFNEKRKFAATLRMTVKDGDTIFVKGAAELVLAMCKSAQVGSRSVTINHPSVAHLKARLEAMTGKGLRVLAVAHKRAPRSLKELSEPEVTAGLIFDGFIGLRDLPRPEVSETLKLARLAGLRPVIITGDHKLTTLSIANELGLKVYPNEAVEGSELDGMSDEELVAKVPDIKIYARVTPAHKLRVIDAWQRRGEVVAMTGDGVNDAPALKRADIGMSLGSGTEVAKTASDLVLLDDKFSTIVAAIEQGRIIYENIRRVMVYLLSDSFSSATLILGSLFLGVPMPLLPAMILWNNLVTDGPPNLALTFEPGAPGVMSRPPRRRNEPLVNSQMRFFIIFVGLLADFIFLSLYLKILDTVPLTQARTVMFAAIGMSSLLYAFSLKDMHRFIWQSPLFNNLWLVCAVLLGVAMELSAVYWPPLQTLLHTTPLPLSLWAWVLGLGLIKIVGMELAKAYFLLRRRPVFNRFDPERRAG